MAHIGNRTTFKTGQALDLDRADAGLAESWAETLRALARSGLMVEQSGFARGTLIDTPDGPVAVEDLRVGDLVETVDNGAQPLTAVGTGPAVARVEIAAGALGNAEAVTLAADHHVLLCDGLADLLFGEFEVLARVGDLVDGKRIRLLDGVGDLVSLDLPRHAVVRANGIECEAGPIPRGGLAARPILEAHEVAVLRSPLDSAGYVHTAIAARAA